MNEKINPYIYSDIQHWSNRWILGNLLEVPIATSDRSQLTNDAKFPRLGHTMQSMTCEIRPCTIIKLDEQAVLVRWWPRFSSVYWRVKKKNLSFYKHPEETWNLGKSVFPSGTTGLMWQNVVMAWMSWEQHRMVQRWYKSLPLCQQHRRENFLTTRLL